MAKSYSDIQAKDNSSQILILDVHILVAEWRRKFF
eukprot:CAMPEP_0176399868 /NCGR_PEP_ID=MMETSP0126-20121128/47104_1 /TAXON_ID=141414 ORGANISM="Strombidinopsis acuminatum, Strain SPMC142" /NCGR_SAMPLE_ID=MMETSP0126 /ASSEMBLY_ACC=CAM_ASM_000229 /LENGTH=34 /DNA_ID= /DNA_START= /DNA_END= /DNA_ORIENTATION=